MNKKFIARSVGLLLTLFLLVGCGNSISAVKLNSTVLGQQGSKIQISLPFALDTSPPINMGEMRSYITRQENYQGKNKDLEIQVMSTNVNMKAMPANWKPSLDAAANEVVNAFSNARGITNLQSSKTNTTVSGKPAMMIKLTYTKENESRELNALAFYDDNAYCLWQILTQYKKSDDSSKITAQNILQSVSLK